MASMSVWPLRLHFGQVRQGVIHAYFGLAQAGHVLGRLRHGLFRARDAGVECFWYFFSRCLSTTLSDLIFLF
jgi:hypothetical protein